MLGAIVFFAGVCALGCGESGSCDYLDNPQRPTCVFYEDVDREEAGNLQEICEDLSGKWVEGDDSCPAEALSTCEYSVAGGTATIYYYYHETIVVEGAGAVPGEKNSCETTFGGTWTEQK
jgi:hypothetical protein